MIVKRGLGRQHTTFMPCKNAACSNEGFLRLDKANGIFAAYFKLRGCDTQIYFRWLLFLFGMICPLI